MKIIFLDIDGVINSVRSMVAWHSEYKASWTNGDPDSPKNKILRNHVDSIAVKLLNRITDQGVKYVISSSHRKLYRNLSDLRKHISDMGLTGEVVCATGHDPKGFRGNEIKEWLDGCENTVTHWAILDDSTDMLAEQKPNCVFTDAAEGLSYSNYEQLLKILGTEDHG